MTTTVPSPAHRSAGRDGWYGVSPTDVATRLGVDPGVGLTGQQAAALLQEHGPNALPAEAQEPGWRRFLDQYRSYMQTHRCLRRPLTSSEVAVRTLETDHRHSAGADLAGERAGRLDLRVDWTKAIATWHAAW